MSTLPGATVVVSETASALAGGLDLVCVLAPVPSNADMLPRLYGSAKAVYDYHGYSEGVEYCAFHAAETGKGFLFVGLPIGTPGAIGREDTTGNTGTCVTTLAEGGSGVLSEHDGVLTVITGGTIGTDQIVLGLSLDGGFTARRVRLGVNNSYAIPYVGVTVSFASGTLVAGDTIHTWHGSGPVIDTADLATARANLAAQQKLFRSCILIGDLPNDTAAAAYRDFLNAYKTSNKRAVYGLASVYDRLPYATMSQTSVRMTGAPSVTFAEVGETGDTITRNTGSWITDGFLTGDILAITSPLNTKQCAAKATVTSATVITLDTDDLVAENVGTAVITAYGSLTFSASANTVIRNRGSWVDDGFRVGDSVTITDSVSNNGTFTVAAVTAAVLDLGDGLADEVASIEDVTVVAGQLKSTWMAAVDAEFATIDAADRISLGAGRGRKISPFTGWYWRRPVSWADSVRTYQHDVQIATWRKKDGPTGWDLNDVDGNLVDWDDLVDGGAGVGARFTCFRTWSNGPNGAFIALSLTRASDSSLLTLTANRAVVDLAENTVQLNTENAAIGVDLVLNTDGTATKASLSVIEKQVNDALELALLAPGKEGQRASYAKWSADSTVLFNVAEPTMLGTLKLVLNGKVHSVYTTVQIVAG